MNSWDFDRIVAYIRQQRDLYTREAITGQLRDAGISPATIDAAWAAVESGQSSYPATDTTPPSPHRTAPTTDTTPPPQQRTDSVFFVLFWFMLLLILGLLQLTTDSALGSGSSRSGILPVLNIAFVLLEAGTLVGGLLFLNRRRSFAAVLGAVGLIYFLWSMIVVGTCIGGSF
jgi:hypothetical protein